MVTPAEIRSTLGDWFDAQAVSCEGLGSPLYGALLPAVGEHIRRGRYDDLLAPLERWRFGDAMPLRLMGAAHRLALAGDVPVLADAFASCGGATPDPIPSEALAETVLGALSEHAEVTDDYLRRAVQTNETGRAAALVLGLSALGRDAPTTPISLVEVGTSAGLNLRLDRFAYLDGAELLGGDPEAPVRLRPTWRGGAPTLHPWSVGDRVGLDPDPADPFDEAVALRLRSYLWPDQVERRRRLDGAIALAGEVPAELVETGDTATTLDEVLTTRAGITPTLVFQSIMWQYVPTAARWDITRAIESAGERTTDTAPLMRVTFEPDEFRRDRVAVHARRWPGGSGTLLAHADYHGRWVQSLPTVEPT